MAPAPAPSMAALPHGTPQGAHVYNVPRAPEVYTLADNVDATIPPEVREQFQRDEDGRVLFFTAPPLVRPDNRVAEQHAGLGHSVRHLATIKQLREERARKRKERDEALAREQEDSKRQAAAQEEDARRRAEAEAERSRQAELLEKVLLGWAADMDRGTELLGDQLGGLDSWKEMMRRSREETEGKTDEEVRVANLRWLFDEQLRRGEITLEQKKQYEDCFIHRTHLEK
jgi:chromatin structure-remodeling complex subunit RSC1/2